MIDGLTELDLCLMCCAVFGIWMNDQYDLSGETRWHELLGDWDGISRWGWSTASILRPGIHIAVGGATTCRMDSAE